MAASPVEGCNLMLSMHADMNYNLTRAHAVPEKELDIFYIRG